MRARRTITAAAWALWASSAAPSSAQDLAPFVPPPCVPGQEMFTDVPASNPFCAWVEQLSRDHITGGCGPQLFCPQAPLTRAQMSVFLELAMRGTDTWDVNADLLDGLDSTDFVTAVGAGTGLTGGGSGGNPSLALASTHQLPQTCNGGQVAQWTGSTWTCGNPGTGTVTSVATGAGLTGGPITTSGTIGVAPSGITSAMIADGAVGGADITDGSVGAVDVASAQVQLRVATPCAPGQFIRAVNADGTAVCAQDADSGGTVTSVATGAGLTGGPITGSGTVGVATGGITSVLIADGTVVGADVADGTIAGADIADGSVGAVDVAPAQVQLRVGSPCATGEFMRAVNADGSVVCASDGNSGGTVTSVATGAGLTGGTITGSGTVSVATGGITGAMIADGTVGAADVASAQVQLRVSQSCPFGQYMSAVNANGTVFCTSDTSHNHFGQVWTGSDINYGLHIVNTGGGSGLWGATNFPDGSGVRGDAWPSTGGTFGVEGTSWSSSGVGVGGGAYATSGTTVGVQGMVTSPQGFAVFGIATATTGTNYGIFGMTSSSAGYAGYLQGRVHVTSNLTVGGVKSFKIDHPLDPANKYLVHAAVESSEVLNMYSGTVVLNAAGEGVVTLPDWFEALNRDFRYQLTCIGGYAPVYVASEIENGRFAIAGGRAGLKVSWQVIAARSDAHLRAHPMVVEEDKPEEERGTYLDPEAHGQPAERGRDHAITSALGRKRR